MSSNHWLGRPMPPHTLHVTLTDPGEDAPVIFQQHEGSTGPGQGGPMTPVSCPQPSTGW